jgi:hypothetical protein
MALYRTKQIDCLDHARANDLSGGKSIIKATVENFREPGFSDGTSFTDATMTSTLFDGKTSESHNRAGDPVWRDPVTHFAKNLDNSEVHTLLVEPKESCKALALSHPNRAVFPSEDISSVHSVRFVPPGRNGILTISGGSRRSRGVVSVNVLVEPLASASRPHAGDTPPRRSRCLGGPQA